MRRARPLLAVLALAGCAARAPLPAPSAPVPATLPTRDVLQRSMAERRAAVTSLRSIARLRYTTAGRVAQCQTGDRRRTPRPAALRGPVACSAPSSCSPPMTAGSPPTTATTTPSTAESPRSGTSPATRRWICRSPWRSTCCSARRPCSPAAAAWCRATRAPSSSGSRAATASASSGSTRDSSRFATSGATPPDTSCCESATADYGAVGGVRLPAHISLELPPSGRRIDIDLRDPEVNPPLSNEIFALQTPPRKQGGGHGPGGAVRAGGLLGTLLAASLAAGCPSTSNGPPPSAHPDSGAARRPRSNRSSPRRSPTPRPSTPSSPWTNRRTSPSASSSTRWCASTRGRPRSSRPSPRAGSTTPTAPSAPSTCVTTCCWHDGKPFTAADVVFTFEAIFDDRVPNSLKHMLTVDGKPI